MATETVGGPPQSSRAGASRSRLRRGGGGLYAARRVANYLQALGLSDRARVRELSQQIASAVVVPGSPEEHAERAVAEAQARFDAWRAALHSVLPEGVDPLWLRAFVSARPELFLGDVLRGQRAALSFGDPLLGKKPRRARFRPQTFEPAQVPAWLRGLAPPVVLCACATYTLWHAVAAERWGWLELAWVGLFAFLFFLAAVGWSTAALGYLTRPRRVPVLAGQGLAEPALAAVAMRPILPRTALVVPIYHEDVEEVFSALAGMREALAALPCGDAFEIFVLSDSRDPELCADEEQAFRRVAAGASSVAIYYHRRVQNVHQKAGNLAEFFETWGPRYEYAVTLDADSVMSAPALVELVRRMEADPKLALLQAPLILHRAETPFARALQFSSSVCGPVFTRGLSIWSGAHANYYGHNAVVRVKAFLDCCALPKLNGEPPFGGQVLSHDFVEAALLCRAGWHVRIADELGSGSYEETPPNLPDYVARDHRWCQGNFQHLRIASMQGLKAMSRIHLLLGACSYLAAPAWLCFMLLGVLLWRRAGSAFEHVAAGVSLVTLIVLLGPWCMGLAATLGDRPLRQAHGGALRLVAGTLLGVLQGAMLAPILMLHHTRIVIAILSGNAVGWAAQQRRASGTLARVVRAEWPATLLGVAAAVWSWFASPVLFSWFAPLWLPWVLSIPIVLAVSSPALGGWQRRRGLLSVPSELQPEALLSRIEALRALTHTDATAHYRNLVLDPVLVAAHIARLGDEPCSVSPGRLGALRNRALRQGPASLSVAEWRLLAKDRDSMQLLHREAWRRWPVESYDLGRDGPQVPPDTRREAPPSETWIATAAVPSVPASVPLESERARTS